MAKKKVSRKELLKKTDEFLSISARAVIFIKEHSRHFQYVGMGIVVVLLIYLGVSTYMGYMNRKAQDAYNTAYFAINKVMVPDASDEARKKSVELFQKVLDDYGLSKASRLVPLELAYLKFQEKKYDETISLYLQFLKNLPDDSPYRSMSWLALAACYEEKGDFTKAAEYLKKIESTGDDFFKDQAMLNLARVYRLSGEKEKSMETLGEFEKKFKDSPFLPLARAHLKK